MTIRGGPDSKSTEEEVRQATRDGYQRKMEGQLEQWSLWLAALRARAEKAGRGTRKDLLARLAELEELEVAGRRHLATIQTAAAAWDEVKTEIAEGWNRISGAVDAIWERVLETASSREKAAASSMESAHDDPSAL